MFWFKHSVLIVIVFFISCNSESEITNPDDNGISTEGIWYGKLDHSDIFLTIIETKFEEYYSLRGSATLTRQDNECYHYVIRDGFRVDNDSVFFSLYESHDNKNKDYFIKAEICNTDTISGTFQFYIDSVTAGLTGPFFVKRENDYR